MRARRLWLATWLVWLAGSAAQPVPPWSAPALLAQEESLAERFAESAEGVPVWSIDVGGRRQSRALLDGWAVPETFVAGSERRTFAWVDGASASVTFIATGWERAVLSLDASPLDSLAPLAVRVDVDGVRQGEVTLNAGWNVAEAILGRIEGGRHELRLTPARRERPPREERLLSFAVAGLGLSDSPIGDPDRDRGAFAGVRRIGLDDRPAVFVSNEAELRESPAATVLPAESGIMSWCGLAAPAFAGPPAIAAQVLSGLAAALLLTVLTGLVWVRSGSPAARLAQALGFSALALLASFALLLVLGVPPAPLSLAAVLFLAGLASRLRPGTPAPIEGTPIPWLLALGSLAALVVFATRVVPPLEDQDMEVQGTAHALATRLVPRSLTNRGTTYFFAHPPLLHLFEAGAFALSGRLERVAYYDEAAQAAAGRPFVEPSAGAPPSERPHFDAWRRLLARFLAEPHLWPTRQVNVVLGACAVALLAGLAGRACGSPALGALIGLYWITLPETLVRGAYGGYFSLAVLLSLLVLAALAEGATPRALAGVAALAFFSEQKALLVPIGWLVGAPSSAGWRRFWPVIGAAAAAAAFVAYGLGVAGREFVFEFLKEHVARRLMSGLAADGRGYASPWGLWAELAAHYGAWLIVAGAIAVLGALRRSEPEVRAAAWAVLIGAVVFTATDWRQTKHLALLVPPALLCIAAVLPRTSGARAAAGLALVLATTWNVAHSAVLLVRFDAIRPTPTW